MKILKHQLTNGKGTGRLVLNSEISPEIMLYVLNLLNNIPGMNVNSNYTVGNYNTEQKENIDNLLRKERKAIAREHAYRAVLERENKLRLKILPKILTNNNSFSGTIQDADNINLNNNMAYFGLSNGLGLTTNISDNFRSNPNFALFVGKTVPVTMGTIGTFVAAPLTALFGLGTSYAGSKVGEKIGEKFGNKELGSTIGSFTGPVAASGFNATIRPVVLRTFANEFGTAYGYNQLLRVPYFTKTLLKGGAKEYPSIKTTPEGDYTVSLIEKSKRKLYDGNDPAEVGRAQAVSKYSGAPDENSPMYLRNQNGSYQYNTTETPYNMFGLFRNRKGEEALKRLEGLNDNTIVWGDFIGNNGGNVSLKKTGLFTLPNGETYNRYMMRDVWDLQPIYSFADKLGSWLNSKTFGLASTIESLIGSRKAARYIDPIYNFGDKLESGIRKIGRSRLINREVGRIVGAKPFVLEHPFAVRTQLVKSSHNPVEYLKKDNTINLFDNLYVPGTLYSTPYELNLEMPFDFSRLLKNFLYPSYNTETLKKNLIK